MLTRVALAMALLLPAAAPAWAQDPGSDALPMLSEAPRRVPKFQPRIAPLDIGANDGFNLLLFTPPLDGAYTLGPGRGTVFTRWHLSRTRIGSLDQPYRFAATLSELRVNTSMGLPGFGAPAEVRFGFSVAQLSGSERWVAATYAGQPVVPSGWQGSASLRRGWVALKLGLLDLDDPNAQIATSGWCKLPVDGADHLTDTGDVELGAMLHVSYSLRVPNDRIGYPNVFFHLMGGGMWRRSQEALATRVRPQPGAVYGAAMLVRFGDWPLAVAFQVRGQVNGWQELQGFSSDPLALQAGMRAWSSGLFYEGGVSFGLTDQASAEWTLEFAAGMVF